MAINLNHYKSAIEIPVGSTPDTPTSGGALFVKADGKLYYKDSAGVDTLADGSNIADADVVNYGYDLTGVNTAAVDTELVSTQMTSVNGAHYDEVNQKLYLVGDCAFVEEVPDPNMVKASLTGWTLTNNSIFSAANDRIEFSGGNTFGISFDTNAVISRSYTVTYRRTGLSTDSVAPVVGGVALTAQTYNGTYEEVVVATSATSLFSVTGTVTDNNIQFELVSVTHTTSTPEGIRGFDVTTLDGTTLTLAYNFDWFDFTGITESRGIAMSSDGTKALVGSNADDSVYDIAFSTGGVLVTGTQEGTPFAPTEVTDLEDIDVSPNGKFLYISDGDAGLGNEVIYQYELDTAWDGDTASYTQISSGTSLYNYLTATHEFKFSPDGRRLYTMDTGFIYQHDVTVPWNLDSLVYDITWGINTNRHGLFFAEDGKYACYGIGAAGSTYYMHVLPTVAQVYRATETQDGLVRLSTIEEAEAATSSTTAITPYTLKKWGLTNAGIVTEDVHGNVVGGTNAAGNMASNGSSYDNVVLGESALSNLITVTDSVIIGNEALLNQNTGTLTGVTAIGSFAFGGHPSTGLSAPGQYSTAIGASAGKSAVGSFNTLVGAFAMGAGNSQVAGADNVAIGYRAADSMTSPTNDKNVFIGSQAAGAASGNLDENVIIGYNAAVNGSGNLGNVVIGSNGANRLYSASSKNIIIGYNAGPATTNNPSEKLYIDIEETDTPFLYGDMTTVGTKKLTVNGDLEVTGTFTGGVTPVFTEDAQENLFGGTNAGAALEATANDNILIGLDAGRALTSGDNNVAVGSEAADNLSTGSGNIAIGWRSMWGVFGSPTTGSNNVVIGTQAGEDCITSFANNALVGGLSGRFLTTGSSNTAIGYQSLSNTSMTTGNFNVCVGYNTAQNVQGGSDNVFIGPAAGPTTAGTYNDELYIHNTTSDTPLIHGVFDPRAVTINGDLQVTQHIYFDAEVANGTATAIDWGDGNKQTIAPTAATSPTYTFTAPHGPTNLTLKATNLGAVTAVTWPATVKWPGGTEPTWTAAGTDIISFYYDGTNYHGSASIDSK